MASSGHANGDGVVRRDFLTLAATAFGAVGTAGAIWPFISQMSPSADVLALSTTEVDLSKIAVGQSLTILWRGKPVFIRHRTEEEISEADAVPLADLRDPQTDAERATKPEWLVIVGVCTHLGCVPLGNKPGEPKGDFGGWFCPCHGSHYDTAGRIRKGPAPLTLPVPEYAYLTDTSVRIG